MRTLMVLVFLVGAVFMAGCGGESSTSAPAKPSEESSTAKKQATDERATTAREKGKATDQKPVDLIGDGQSTSERFELQSGLRDFGAGYEAKNPYGEAFIVTLIRVDGSEPDELLFNEVMKPDDPNDPLVGTKAVRIRSAGTYVVQVKADGPWTVVVR